MAINQLAIVEGIVGLILSTAAVDTVAVFGSGFTQLFPNARPLQDQVRENSRVMDHPLESGQLISDYKVILPIEIEMPMMVSSAYYLGTYQQIKAAYLSSELLTVLTRTGSYPNMIISEMPHQEDPERYNSITILLRFRQVQLVQPSVTGTSANPSYAPANPTQAPTQNTGQQPSNTIAGVATQNGVQTIPYAPQNSPLSPETQVIQVPAPGGGTTLIPLFPDNNPLTSGGSINGLLQNSSGYEVSGIATAPGGQAQAAGTVLTFSAPQALGVQGGL